VHNAQNGKTEVDEEDGDGDEAEVVVVSAVPLLTTSGTTEGQMLTNTAERDAAAGTMENTTGADHLLVEIVSRGGEGGAVDTDQTRITVKVAPLLIMALTRFHLRRLRTPRTQHHLSPLRHPIHSLLHPLLHHLCLGRHL